MNPWSPFSGRRAFPKNIFLGKVDGGQICIRACCWPSARDAAVRRSVAFGI